MNHSECTTAPEKILLAAVDLESPFTAESLVVAAWRRFPKAFGLAGHADQFPDSNRCLCVLMGRRGMVSRGMVDRAGRKLYRLTGMGRRMAQGLLGEAAPAAAVKPAKGVRPAAELDALLRYLFSTSAVSLYRAGKRQELTFGHAVLFWSIRDGDVIGVRLTAVESAIKEVDRIVTPRSELVLGNGRVVTPDDALLLGEVDGYLREKFSRHLDVLGKREAAKA